jgi:hypothetical protein
VNGAYDYRAPPIQYQWNTAYFKYVDDGEINLYDMACGSANGYVLCNGHGKRAYLYHISKGERNNTKA